MKNVKIGKLICGIILILIGALGNRNLVTITVNGVADPMAATYSLILAVVLIVIGIVLLLSSFKKK